MKIKEITTKNLENAETGDVIVTPYKGEFKIQKVYGGIWLYKNEKNGDLVYRDYADNYVWAAEENTFLSRLHYMYEVLARWAIRTW